MNDPSSSPISAAGGSPAPDVRAEQVSQLYRYLPLSLLANVLLAACAGLSLKGEVADHRLAAWMAALFGALILRSAPLFGVRRYGVDVRSAAVWEWLFSLGACATGVVWGFSFPMLDVASIPEAQRWFALAILIVSGAGIASGGVFVMSQRAWPPRLFLASILIPAFVFFVSGGLRERVFAALILIFMGFLYRSSSMTASVILNNLLLRREAMANELSAKVSQRERDAATEEFRSFAAALPDLLLKFDAGGSILWANPNAERILGSGPGGLLNRSISEFLAADGRDALSEIWRHANGKGSCSRELRFRTMAGDKPYLFSTAPIRDHDGRAVALVAVGQDVSSLKAIESQLQLARDEAERASRAKSEFVANMSHEIRTPLNAVIGLSELAMDQPLPAGVRDYMERIHLSGANLLAIVNDVLDFSKIEAGKLEIDAAPFSLGAILEQVRTHGEVLAQGKDLAIRLVQGPDLPGMLIGDAVRVSQVLTNLVSNAVKFTPVGFVEIRSDVVERRGSDVTVMIRVSDSGIGMSPEQIQRIFQPFTQADPSTTRRFGGTGLGLTICTRLVGLMGGEIEVHSRVGGGSSFSVRLGLRAASEAVTAPDGRAQPADALPSFAGRTALLAEDNPVNLLVAEANLKKLGLSVEIAVNGREVLEKIDTQPSRFDVVFMDVQMPLLDGIEATRIIRRTHPGSALPIIALTANAFEQDRASCLEAGMNDFISKPFRLKDVAATLSRWIDPADT